MLFTLLSSRFWFRRCVRCGAVALLLGPASPARAEVTRVEIVSRADLPYAGYEKIVGRVFFAVDPANPRNAVIVDIDKAPRTANGRVEFSADFYAVRPKTGGNGVAIVDVVNRGNRVTRMFNRVTAGNDPDVGDGFLFRRGFTVIAVGWEFDLPEGGAGLRIRVPAAEGVTGLVRTLIEVDRRNSTYKLTQDVPAYRAVDPAGSDTTLTVRERLSDAPRAIARSRWRLSDDVVSLDGGFEPGKVYEISYRVTNPPVAGLGLAAVRDIASWAKHAADAVTPAKYIYAHGQSQTGRFLREFLYLGFNADERERLVFDGVRLIGNTGSYVPFAPTQAERQARRDPRPSIQERYPSRGDYLAKVRAVIDTLVRDRYMLAEDVEAAVERANAHWELVTGSTTTSASAR